VSYIPDGACGTLSDTCIGRGACPVRKAGSANDNNRIYASYSERNADAFRKAVDVGDGKVLLSNIGGKIVSAESSKSSQANVFQNATSAYCTHVSSISNATRLQLTYSTELLSRVSFIYCRSFRSN
jgi:hypothetical protein